jgi:transcriptional regulator with XRE-family HTH domain
MPAMPLDTDKMEARRKALGLTQHEAAMKAKLSGKSYWADIVSGRRSNLTIQVLDSIAKALGVSTKELLK